MSVLIQLPEAVLLGIYQDWIDIRALGRLDSAICSLSHRSQFLDIIRVGLFQIKTPTDSESSESSIAGIRQKNDTFLEWLIMRKMKIRNWFIIGNPPPHLLMDLAEHSGGLHVRSIYLAGENLEPAVVFCSASHRCPKLEVIRIIDCFKWAEVSVLRGAAQDSLQELHVNSSGYQTTGTFVRSYYPNLRILRLEGLCGDNSVAGLLAAAPNLRDLRLLSASVNDRCLSALCNHVQALDVLMLCCLNVTAPKLRALAEQCPALKVLCLPFAGIEVVEHFAQHCKHLEGLCVANSSRLSLGALQSVLIQCGSNLRYLMLDAVPLPDQGEDLVSIGEHNPLLEVLVLSGSTTIAASTMQRLLPSLRCLRELELSECVVTDMVLVAIAEHLPHLQILNLFRSRDYTAVGAKALFMGLRELRRFEIEPGHPIFNSLVIELWKARLPGLIVVEGNGTEIVDRFPTWR